MNNCILLCLPHSSFSKFPLLGSIFQIQMESIAFELFPSLLFSPISVELQSLKTWHKMNGDQTAMERVEKLPFQVNMCSLLGNGHRWSENPDMEGHQQYPVRSSVAISGLCLSLFI